MMAMAMAMAIAVEKESGLIPANGRKPQIDLCPTPVNDKAALIPTQ